MSGLSLLSDAYLPTDAQRKVVVDAEDRLIADCMRQFGFAWRTASGTPAMPSRLSRAYGVGNMETAQRYGYHFAPDDPRDAAARERLTGGVPVSAAENLVLAGSTDPGIISTISPGSYNGRVIPVGGCAGQARREVTGVDQIDPSQLAQTIGVNAFAFSKGDSRVVTVVEAWSTCMKESGYSFVSPLDVSSPSWSMTSPAATSDEIQTAVSDMGCKQRTNLIGVWHTVQCAYESRLIQHDIERLTQIKLSWEDAARKAAQILGVTAPQS